MVRYFGLGEVDNFYLSWVPYYWRSRNWTYFWSATKFAVLNVYWNAYCAYLCIWGPLNVIEGQPFLNIHNLSWNWTGLQHFMSVKKFRILRLSIKCFFFCEGNSAANTHSLVNITLTLPYHSRWAVMWWWMDINCNISDYLKQPQIWIWWKESPILFVNSCEWLGSLVRKALETWYWLILYVKC